MGWSSKPKTPGPTEQERASAEIAARQWNRYKEVFLPAEDRFLDMAKARESGAVEAQRMAEATAGEQFGGRLDSVLQNPGSGAVRTVADLSSAYTGTVGASSAAAKRALRARELQSKLRIAALGRGLASDSLAGTASLGQRATAAALAENERRLGLSQALVSGASTALGMYGAREGWFDSKKG